MSQTRYYDYFTDPANTELLASIRADSLALADGMVKNRHGVRPEDLFLVIRQPKERGEKGK